MQLAISQIETACLLIACLPPSSLAPPSSSWIFLLDCCWVCPNYCSFTTFPGMFLSFPKSLFLPRPFHLEMTLQNPGFRRSIPELVPSISSCEGKQNLSTRGHKQPNAHSVPSHCLPLPPTKSALQGSLRPSKCLPRLSLAATIQD